MKKLNFILLAAVLLSLTGCADHMPLLEAANATPVGFWYGFWHGLILPFAWIGTIFSDDIAIYAVYNNGSWYDFGFVMGVSSYYSATAS
jgi:apolipoprotein N-acyltransferase